MITISKKQTEILQKLIKYLNKQYMHCFKYFDKFDKMYSCNESFRAAFLNKKLQQQNNFCFNINEIITM